MGEVLKAPFPWFGGKSRVADLVWERIGDVVNYIEPFAGTIAVLLRRPPGHLGKVETVNDANHLVTNFWRAVRADPDKVAEYADWPVTEADLHARHRWLMDPHRLGGLRGRLEVDAEAYDAKTAGWWVWGQCCWIGGGWCSTGSMKVEGDVKACLPEMTQRKGVNGALELKRPMIGDAQHKGVHAGQVPDLSGDSGVGGRGVAAMGAKVPDVGGHANGTGRGVAQISGGRPQLGDVYDIGRGVNSNEAAGTCAQRRKWLVGWMRALADRLRLVRTCYGDWERVCGSRTTTTRIGVTGVFLDPPYAVSIERMHGWLSHIREGGDPPTADGEAQRHAALYANDKTQDVDHLVARVLDWCLRQGEDPQMRIALCGYAGEHDVLEGHGWEVESWKAGGGYGNRNADNSNKERERVWFSPACVGAEASAPLFGGAA